ncbi:transglycosylase domain-containing protein [Viridibacillus sp. FSL R5-0477]|uniref:Penicillin-binding protein 1A/1B (PBP1) n=1 Tax=Viridibacillus arenosi FSL R5-213 TaxID=1227360 RepID=W4EKK8_9BACL|nr:MULTISPECIES: transglycosylase domain-containing protein [Viridibacillus]ETT81113.1 penicillin-binding protein 1A/1B (PBP1) [Viridibacillus arenosi FSL R5-213]OMC84063.1 penicillin-binding protein 1A [Viridibacillus sp. FSL H8-0123]OMC88585.1 penicillin-binding protein 1A [Viridibacillus sp. FSL H7-0596]OMC93218.1 penicillin-binding protein 1A [Viridibacillus arenosi]
MGQEINSREQRRKMREQQQKKQKKPMKVWLKRLLIAIVSVGIVLFIAGATLFAYYAATAPDLDEELLKDPVSSQFYDSDGKVFYTMGLEKREHVAYEDIPTEMRDAILATEDVRFFSHHGIDFYRLGGAILANLRHGFGAQGASTLTQQVIKNSFLQNEKTLKRKAQEAYLAIQLEREYSKEEIFEMYFNKVLMSGRIYGYGTASKYFYGKELKDLKLEEMALLAGMSQLPNAYNPFKYPEYAEKRRNTVLGLMYQHKKITKEQMEAAKKVDVEVGLLPENKRKTASTSKYDAYIDVVLKELAENGDGKLLEEGINVYTTLDSSAQKIVETTMNSDIFPTKEIQSGMAVVDTETGAIVAIGGGRDYGPERGLNYAEAIKNQPGSTMKPIMDYGPAIENLKYSTGQTITDEKMFYTGSSKQINNFDKMYKGDMTLREALYTSRNVPAVKLLKEVGTDKAKKFINNLGIEADEIYESDAIGGGKISLSPIEMAGAYAAFGNNGIYTTPHSIKKIVYRDGKTAKSYTPDPTPAMNDYTAYMVTDMLRDVVGPKYGASGTAAAIPGLDIAGKTGTTNYGADEFQKYNLPESAVPDSWFAGYSSKYSISVWSGYTNRKDPITTTDERLLPQRLFKTVMSQISANTTTPNFKKPNSVVEAKIVKGSKPLQLASSSTPADRTSTELFVKGTVPTNTAPVEEVEKLEAPTDLKATFDEEANAINLSWAHKEPKDKSVSFEVSVSVDGGGEQKLTQTSDKAYTYSTPQDGKTYVFSVIAIADDEKSAAASTSIQIKTAPPEEEVTPPEENEQPEVPEIPVVPEEPTEDDNGNNNPDNGTPPVDNNDGIKPDEDEEEVDTSGTNDDNSNDNKQAINSNDQY